MPGIQIFETIPAFLEAFGIDNDSKKLRVLSGVSIERQNNNLYVVQGMDKLLCDLVPNHEVSTEKLEVSGDRLGPYDVLGRYIKSGPLDDKAYLLIERTVKYN